MPEPLELILTTRLKGGEEINKGADAARKFSEEEQKTADALAKALGPFRAMEKAQRDLNAARQLGMNSSFVRDLEYKAAQTQKRVETIQKGGQSQGEAMAQAFMSSRFGGKNGGAMPLVGQTLKAIGGEGLVEGVAGVVGKFGPVAAAMTAVAVAGYKLMKAMTDTALESAKATQAFSDLRTQGGGTSGDSARLAGLSRITGVGGGSGARGFNDRITSDPLAMGVASQFGLQNAPGPFGRMDYGRQYVDAIKRVSAISNEDMRRRTAMVLGIEQEVARYSKLGPEARERMDKFAKTTARVNNPEAERRAAQLQAAVENEAQARENMKTALGQLFGGGTEKLLNWLADTENTIANGLIDLNVIMDKFRSFFGPDKNASNRLEQSIAGVDNENGSSGTGTNSFATAQSANTQAMMANTAAISRLAGIWGGGARANSALPSGLRGANLHTALAQGGLRLGTL